VDAISKEAEPEEPSRENPSFGEERKKKVAEPALASSSND